MNTDSVDDYIIAPDIQNLLKIEGDFSPNLRLTGNSSGDLTLNRVNIQGTVTGGVWQIEGHTGTVRINATSDQWSANFSDTVERLRVSESLSGTLAFENSVEEIVVDADGEITDAVILSGADLGDDGRLGGTGDNADIFDSGTIDNLKVQGNITSSIIGAGLNPIDDNFNNGNDSIEQPENSIFNKVIVNGD